MASVIVPERSKDNDVEHGNVERFHDQGNNAENRDEKVEAIPIGVEVLDQAQAKQLERCL